MAGRTFFGTIRLVVLLAVLAFVATGAWLDRARSRDWDAPLRVTVYPLGAVDDEIVRAYVGELTADDFDEVEQFFSGEAASYGVALVEPVSVRVSRAAAELPPAFPGRPGLLSIALWSLRVRWYAAQVAWDDPLPTPDIQVFATYAAGGEQAGPLPDSVGLSKGLVAIAHLYGDRAAGRTNQVVLAHELLHTLGATDKYDRGSGQPLEPAGLGEPHRAPRYPQDTGEIMAGRIAVSAHDAAMPDGLEQMVVGPATAREIGWTRD
jgi:hypothetical protein